MNILQAFRTLVLMTILLGLAYPLAITALAQLWFPEQANGSLVKTSGRVVGSSLIGQDWTSPRWFQGRPSATGGRPYNPMASGGSNLSPHSKAYRERTSASRHAWEIRAREAAQSQPVPEVLLTASGSGLDPHLDLQAVLWQVPLVAHARSIEPESLEVLVRSHQVPTGWPWDPEPYVNLLALNLDLEQRFGNR